VSAERVVEDAVSHLEIEPYWASDFMWNSDDYSIYFRHIAKIQIDLARENAMVSLVYPDPARRGVTSTQIRLQR
jgi:hypothetical protein